jgi:hypothetical protein
MCFSATASFTSAGLLTIGSLALLSRNKDAKFFPLTLIPIFFALQQMSEGFLWQDFSSHFWKNCYLFFVWVFWPIYIPYSVYAVDNYKWQLFYIGMGLTFACFFGWEIPTTSPEKFHHSIHYNQLNTPRHHPIFFSILYLFITVTPTLISPVKRMWIFGSIGLLTAAFVVYLDKTIFLSLWCFSAAFISLSLFFIVPLAYKNKNL